MIAYPSMDPVAFHLWAWPVYWYGLMYLVGFAGGFLVLSLRLRNASEPLLTQNQLSDLVFFASMGAIIGGRIGYMLFYDFQGFLANPIILFQPWKGGMAFHGGLLGVIVAMIFCSYKMQKRFLRLTDFLAPAVPIGLGAGRIGNFINGELWGRMTEVPWAMVFPRADYFTRHPSQLYEFLLEGVVLFLILWIYSQKTRPLGAISGLFAVLYGLFRIIAECFREPDQQIGYIAFGWMTKGQLLSLPLIIIGAVILLTAYFYRRERLT